MFISSIIFTLLTGILSTSYLFSANNFLSAEIVKNSNLAEINPLGSLGSVTLPLDKIWQALSSQLKSSNLTEDIKNSITSDIPTVASKSTLEESFQERLEKISLWQALGIAKTAFIVGAQVLVAMMEITIKVLKLILGLIT